MELSGKFSMLSRRACRSSIRESLKLTSQPGHISFSGGWPHPEAFPVIELQEICRDLLSSSASSCLQYCPTEGLPQLREQLLLLSNKIGLKIQEDELLVSSGSQQALDLLARVFIDPGDLVVIENPSFVSAIAAFRVAGARFLPVPMDIGGMRSDELEATLAECKKTVGGSEVCAHNMPKFIYTIPDFQNPTGYTLAEERRAQLLELAERFDLLIVEDVPYRWLRFRGKDLPLLGAAARSRRVINIFSLSKTIAPGLRLAWITGERTVIDKLVQVKQAADLCTSSFTQLMAAEFLRRGFFEPVVRRATGLYRRKMLCMHEALQEHLSSFPGVKWTIPKGGIFLWLTLPEGMDSAEMLAEAIKNGIAYIPGLAFFPNGGGRNTLRLNYSFPSEQMIREGISRLAQVIHRLAAGQT